jgi:hypothetical protein
MQCEKSHNLHSYWNIIRHCTTFCDWRIGPHEENGGPHPDIIIKINYRSIGRSRTRAYMWKVINSYRILVGSLEWKGQIQVVQLKRLVDCGMHQSRRGHGPIAGSSGQWQWTSRFQERNVSFSLTMQILTDSMELGPSSEAFSCAATQELSAFYGTRKFHYRLHEWHQPLSKCYLFVMSCWIKFCYFYCWSQIYEVGYIFKRSICYLHVNILSYILVEEAAYLTVSF